MYCPQCGSLNDGTAKFCASCGNTLPTAANSVPPADTTTNGSLNTAELYQAILGPKHQQYYLSRFGRFHRNGKVSGSWHWPAFFTTFFWFLYRKMWRNALIYFFLPVFVAILLGVVGLIAGDTAAGVGYIGFWIALFILPPIYANAIYYKHCTKKISDAVASSQNAQRTLGELAAKGGTSNVGVIVGIVYGFFGGIGILAAIALPAYQDYTVRAKVSEAAVVGNKASRAVDGFFYQHHAIPSTIEQTGFADTSSVVKQVVIDANSGTIRVIVNFSPIANRAITYVPSLDNNKRIVWRCSSTDIPIKYLPQVCR